MAHIVKLPKLNLEMRSGELVAWVVDEGDSVKAGELIAEIESEKAIGEIEAPADGVLRRVLLAEGESASPGTPIAIVADPKEDLSEVEVDIGEDAVPESDDDDETTGETRESRSVDAGGTGSLARATPKAKKRANEVGVDLDAVDGTGPGGAVTADDVEAMVTDARATASEEASMTVAEERPLTGMRATIASRLSKSAREAPHVTEHREVNVESLIETTAAVDDRVDVDVTMTDLILVAVAEALADHPAFNATYDAEDKVHRLYEETNLGVAVDIDEGLLTPVVPAVGDKSVVEVAKTRRELTNRTVANEYVPTDLSGGTFTVTNLGPFGVDSFTPIIDPPQVAILGVGRYRTRAVEGDAGPVFQRHATMSLSFDHRVVDGADAARFLGTLADRLANADALVDVE